MLSDNEIHELLGLVGYDTMALENARAVEAAVLAKLQTQSEPVNWNWVDLQNRADEIVRGKVLWKRFIDGTPLANDIACWMADFAQEVAAAPVQAQSEPVPKGVLLALSNAGLTLIKTQHGYEVRKLGQITAQAAPVQQEPVAWMGKGPRDGRVELTDTEPAPSVMRDFNMRPLYAHPAPVQAKGEVVAEVKENPFCPEGTSDELTKYLPVGTKLYAAPVQSHTDHPARHYDRTCAACQQDCNCADQTDCDGKCCKSVQQEELKRVVDRTLTRYIAELEAQNKALLEALKAIADYPELDALEMKREARAAIAQAEKEMK